MEDKAGAPPVPPRAKEALIPPLAALLAFPL